MKHTIFENDHKSRLGCYENTDGEITISIENEELAMEAFFNFSDREDVKPFIKQLKKVLKHLEKPENDEE